MSVAKTISCPYCGHSWGQVVSHPKEPKRPPRGNKPRLATTPTDVRTVPYVRDVGKFDPHPGADWLDPERGSWVGSDFMSFMRFDEKIGILTARGRQWPGVAYRVERCANCLHHFDAYYSFDDRNSLPDHFPHLFATNGEALTVPSHKPLPDHFVEWLSPRSAKGWGAMAAAAVTWWILAGAFMASARLTVGEFFWVEYVIALVSLLFGLLASAVLLHLLRTVLLLLDTPAPMCKVIEYDGAYAKDPISSLNGIHHWVSFTRCRFTGRPRDAEPDGTYGRTPRTTTEVIGGLISVGALVLVVLVVLLTDDATLPIVVSHLVDAVFWLPVAFMVGSGLQIGANTVHYVLAALTRVPLRLDEAHPTGDLSVLRSIQRYVKHTGTTVAVLLVTLVAINTTVRGLEDVNSPLAWVDRWFLLILVIGLFVLGLRRWWYLGFTVLVIAVAIGLWDTKGIPMPFATGWEVAPITVWLGFVFTMMLLVETTATNRLVEEAMRNTLEAKAARLLREAASLSTEEMGRARAELDAARVVVDLRSGLTNSSALAPLGVGVLLPGLLDGLFSWLSSLLN